MNDFATFLRQTQEILIREVAYEAKVKDILRPENYADEAEHDKERQPKGKREYCCHCRCYYKVESWYQPPSCPGCHRSRVD